MSYLWEQLWQTRGRQRGIPSTSPASLQQRQSADSEAVGWPEKQKVFILFYFKNIEYRYFLILQLHWHIVKIQLLLGGVGDNLTEISMMLLRTF